METEKKGIVAQVMCMLGFKPSYMGYQYVLRIISEAWKAKDTDLSCYERYAKVIAAEQRLAEKEIISQVGAGSFTIRFSQVSENNTTNLFII